jgi:iron(III) transport system permease protein
MKITALPVVDKPLFRWSWELFLRRLGLLVFVLIVLGPLLALIAQIIPSISAGNLEWLKLAIPVGRRLVLLINSLVFAASVAVAGVVLGILGGSLLWRWDAGWRGYLRWLIIVLAPIPPYIHALAWTSTIYAVNSWLQKIGLPPLPVQGWVTAWWIQLMSLTPIAIGLALIGLKSVEPLLIDAGRIMRSDAVNLFRVILPLAAPALLAGGGVLFLLSLLDYSVPSLVNLNVYSLEIFAEFSASNQPVRALLLSFPILLIAVVVIFASLSPLRNAAQSTSWRMPTWKVAPAWPKWLVILQWLALAVLVAQIVVPMVSLSADVGTWNSMASAIKMASREINFTFWVSLIVALICLPIALAVARELVVSRKWEKLIWLLVITPLAIPPSLIGIGLITIWNRPLVFQVYGTGIMPVLAGLARFTPIAVIVLAAQLRSLNPLFIDAARILQTNRWQTWKQIWLPMLAPGFLASAGIVFALTLGELGATLLIAPPGQATLTIRIYNFLHYGASSVVAGLCLMMAVVIFIAGTITAIALAGRSYIFSKTITRQK